MMRSSILTAVFISGFATTFALTASAGNLQVPFGDGPGIPCAFNGGSETQCFVPDSTSITRKEFLTGEFIDGNDNTTSDNAKVFNCVEPFNASGRSCGPTVSTLVGGTGNFSLTPDRSWFSGGVLRGFVSGPDVDSYGYVVLRGSGQDYHGLFFTF